MPRRQHSGRSTIDTVLRTALIWLISPSQRLGFQARTTDLIWVMRLRQ